MGGLRWTAAGCLLISILKIRGEPLPAGARGRPSGAGHPAHRVRQRGRGVGGAVRAQRADRRARVDYAVLDGWRRAAAAGRRELHPPPCRRPPHRFCGIVVLVWPEIRVGDSRGFLGGVLATQLACVGWALGSGCSRRRRKDENVLAGVALPDGGGRRACGSWPWPPENGPISDSTSGRQRPCSIYCWWGRSWGFACAYALKHLPIATVSLYAHINLVIAVLLGTVVLREPFSARIAAACAVVLAGTAIVRSESRANVSAPATPRAGPRPASRGRG